MKTRFLLLPTFIFCLLFLRPLCGFGQNLVTIPDANFRAFLEQTYPSCMVGTAGSKQLDTLCAAGVTGSMDCKSKNIASLAGVWYFKNITSLYCQGNQLTSLDVSHNTALTKLYCENNHLTALNILQNTALIALSCGNNQLTTLSVLQITALLELYCEFNQLTALVVSQNTTLTQLNCDNNQLTALDVSQNTALIELSCGNNQLMSLDISQNTALINLYCHGAQLSALDISQNTALNGLYCPYNQLTSLDVSQNTALTGFYCHNNQLTSLDVSQNTALNGLYCNGNLLTSLDVSQNMVLKELYCDYNQLIHFTGSLPNSLCFLFATNNQVTCLPNIPNGTGCPSGFTSDIGYTLCDPNVSGVCFYDYANNGVLDGIDKRYSSKVVELTKNGQTEFLMTTAIGSYAAAVDSGDVLQLKTQPNPDAILNFPTNWDTSFTVLTNFPVVDFRFAADTSYRDPAIAILQIGCPRIGMTTDAHFQVKNYGYGADNPTVTVQYDSLQTFVNTTGAVTLLSHDAVTRTLTYQINNLAPQGLVNFEVYFAIAAGTPLGQPVTVSAQVDSPNDDNLTNNFASYTSFTCGSYDPNDKTAFNQKNEEAEYAANGDTLTYRIRFQNTGNAPALKVEIRDSLNINLLDPLSFEFLTATHPVELSMAGEGFLTFTFDNINLPDSASDPLGSQGAAWFRIRVRPGQACDATLKNRCGIYFDANPPVITNFAQTTLNPTPVIALSSTNLILTPNQPQATLNAEITAAPKGAALSWSSGGTAATETVGAAGTYTLTATGPTGCVSTAAIAVTEATNTLIISFTNTTAVTCFGALDGAIGVTVNGGTPPYAYSWSNGQTTATINSLASGNYDLLVTDADGFTQTMQFNVSSPTPVALTLTAENATCGQANGAISADISGGIAPYTFSWSNGDTTQNLANLPVGDYSLTIKDANGCEKTVSTAVSCLSATEENKNQTTLTLIPNPTTGAFHLAFDSDSESRITVRVMDMNGRVVTAKNLNAVAGRNLLDFDLSAEPAGFYLVKFSDEKTQKTLKIVKN